MTLKKLQASPNQRNWEITLLDDDDSNCNEKLIVLLMCQQLTMMTIFLGTFFGRQFSRRQSGNNFSKIRANNHDPKNLEKQTPICEFSSKLKFIENS